MGMQGEGERELRGGERRKEVGNVVCGEENEG